MRALKVLGKLIKAFLYFTMDIFIVFYMYDGFWDTTLGSWILFITLVLKAVLYVKYEGMIGMAGSGVYLIYGLFQLSKSNPDTFRLIIAIIIGSIIMIAYMKRNFKSKKRTGYVPNNTPHKGTHKAKETMENTHTSYVYEDSYSQPEPNPISSNQMSGECPYIRERDSKYGHEPYYCLYYNADISSDKYFHLCRYHTLAKERCNG